MASIRPEFHGSLVQQQIDDIYYERSNLYYFLGRINPWVVENEPPVEPANTYNNDVAIRNNLLYVRKVTPNDVSLVVPNHTWTTGTVYTQWDDKIDVSSLPFYCITANFNVYKCLNNNNGAASTVEPTGNSLFPFTTSDGYLWKYMYNVPITKRRKFLSSAFIPVQKALTDSFYSKGAVEQVVVTNGGSGYLSSPATTITVGAPSGSGTTAVLSTTLTGGVVTGVTIVSGGTNYLFPPRVTVPSPLLGNTAVITLSITGGVVTGYTIVNGGSGYTTAPTPVVEAPRDTAEILAFVNPETGEIDSIEVTNPGAGYSSAPTLTVVGAGGSGKYSGNPNALLTAYLYQGRIDRVAIVDPGVGYPADTATTISAQGDGTGAIFYPKIEDGVIIGVIIANPGINYSYIDLQVQASSGSGATLKGVIGASDFLSDQSQVEQTAIKGAIYAIRVLNGGTGYTNTTQVSLEGDGTGATATATVVDGVVTKITMVSYGSGYTYANVVISDVNRLEPNTFTDASAYIILPPTGGHGFDAVKELYADTIALSVLVKDDDELSAINQDYRQFGLLRNPLDVVTRRLITTTKSFATFTVEVVSTTDLAVDDILLCNNKRYRIVKINVGELVVQRLDSIYTEPSGYFTKEGVPAVQYGITSVVSVPSLDKYTGDLLYVSNNTPFVPTTSQSFVIRTYITL